MAFYFLTFCSSIQRDKFSARAVLQMWSNLSRHTYKSTFTLYMFLSSDTHTHTIRPSTLRSMHFEHYFVFLILVLLILHAPSRSFLDCHSQQLFGRCSPEQCVVLIELFEVILCSFSFLIFL